MSVNDVQVSDFSACNQPAKLASEALRRPNAVLSIGTQWLAHNFTAGASLTRVHAYTRARVRAWRGVAWRGVAWRGVAWRGVAWRGVAWRGVAWRGVAWRGVAWRGVAWRGVLFEMCS